MTRWKIKRGRATYAELYWGKRSVRIGHLSDWAEDDKFEHQLTHDYMVVFDPRESALEKVHPIEDVYTADLWLNTWIQLQLIEGRESFSIEVEGLDWSEVLPEAEPGLIY